MEEAYETGDKDEIERCQVTPSKRQALAKDIKSKYIAPPRQPTLESCLFRQKVLFRDWAIRSSLMIWDGRTDIVAGPSTLSALLNSYQLVSRLNIQKSADHISKTLASVKTEFGKFMVFWPAQNIPTCLLAILMNSLNRRTIRLSSGRSVTLSCQEGDCAWSTLFSRKWGRIWRLVTWKRWVI